MMLRHWVAALIVTTCFLSTSAALIAQNEDNQPVPIGSIDFFGYGGLDSETVRNHLPIHVGDSFTYKTFALRRTQIEQSIQEVTGKPPSDVAIVCCDQATHLLIYIGLAGSSSHPLSLNPVPHGDDHLAPEALALYDQVGDAIEKAVERGASGEDWSQGYAVSVDPTARELQLKIRAYALDREPELERVLQNSADSRQRSVSAEMIGYSRQSATQIQALAKASLDNNTEVRNNAIRALSVLFSSQTISVNIGVQPFISLLMSGKWTDRNKSGLLLEKITQQRDPATLLRLRQEALKPLIEGAHWQSLGHSYPFLLILGRIGGLSDQETGALIKVGSKEKVIRAAESNNPNTPIMPLRSTR